MKYLKSISIVIAVFIMALMMNGCGDKNIEETAQETTQKAKEVAESVKEEAEEIGDVALQISNDEDLEKWFTENGFETSSEENSVDFNGEIKFADGSALRIPCTYTEITDGGWQYDKDGRGLNGYYFKNSEGKNIVLMGSEESVEESEYNSIKLKDEEKAPEYELFGQITNKSGLSEILETLGSPSNAFFDNDPSIVPEDSVFLEYRNADNTQSLWLWVSTVSDTVIYSSYSVN